MRELLTPELVERRLSELQKLVRLGDSLLEAEMPPIHRTVLERRSLRIEERVPGAVDDPRDVRFRVSPNAIDRHLGWMPDTWVDPHTGFVVATALVLVVAVTDRDGRFVDALPRGCEGIVTLRFLLERPVIDDQPLWLCAARDRARTRW